MSISDTGSSNSKSLWRDNIGHAGTRSAQILLIITLVTVSVFALTKVTLVVIPLLIALILSAAISPAVHWLKAKGVPALWATTIAFLSILTVLATVIAGITFAVKKEWANLVNQSIQGFGSFWSFIKESRLPVDESMIKEVQAEATHFLTSSSFGTGALSGISAAGTFFASLILVIVILFFFLKDGEQIWKFFLNFFKNERRDKVALAGVNSMIILGSYVRGTAAVAGVDAVFIGAGLAILGVPLALPLAVLTFIGGFIPLVGATAAGAFAVLIALVANGPVTALIVLGIVILVNQLEGNFLQPVLMGNALHIHGLVVLLALTIGTVLAGIIGAVLAVPITAVLWAIIKVWRNYPDEIEEENSQNKEGQGASIHKASESSKNSVNIVEVKGSKDTVKGALTNQNRANNTPQNIAAGKKKPPVVKRK